MQISEGDGWRLQLAPGRRPYSALIGGMGWAVELDPCELSALRHGVVTLLAQRRQLLDGLMPEEELDLELDLSLPATDGDIRAAGSLFVALSGNVKQWTLRFVLTPGDGSRAAEGAWSAAASPPLAAALEGLADRFAETL
ncbi:DUF1818 family protein [Synechococcus sp. CBW1004]|uniref:DUF1818 family protein n=1 Tax=Synechococcus sp. CBW1004 TaxID=1353136 RepID=UPI0018CEA3A5|nr:DUF1818 family protein [Synechococcus sp. CBW1004]QPN64551.1 DUF1818 family protein [Synechococcus sp. CBW1004]